MSPKMPVMDAEIIEKRRAELLNRLERDVHPLAIFYDLERSEDVAFTISPSASVVIRRGLANRERRIKESSAIAVVKLAATTPDKTKSVFEIRDFTFESIGTTDSVLSLERDILKPGEIEVHSHLSRTPDYLGHTDVGDLIAAVAGPAWVHPTTKTMLPALRIFGVLSIYQNRIAELQFYRHDLRDSLARVNNYGLKQAGLPLVIKNAF